MNEFVLASEDQFLCHLERYLPSRPLETLIVAVQAKSEETMTDDALLGGLSAYASAGITEIRRQTESKSRTELYEFLLGQSEL